MISLIVSSYKEDLFQKFTKSVEETIGTDYEIIQVFNKGQYGLCEVYNLGLKLANYPYICFVHEDITFNTDNWGEILIQDFESDSSIGLIGVAGSGYKSWVLSGWHTSQHDPTRFIAVNIVHTGSGKPVHYKTNISNENLVQVVSIDGCFMFTHKRIVHEISFDQTSFKNFHCYDIDFSLQVNKRYRVIVDFNILLSHVSGGSYDKSWFFETIKLHNKWKKELPCSVNHADSVEKAKEEEAAFYGIVNAICINKIDLNQLLKIYFSFTYFKLVGLEKWIRTLRVTYNIVKNYY
ncbi:glycosyltransferase family protein [Spirosoma flavus]